LAVRGQGVSGDTEITRLTQENTALREEVETSNQQATLLELSLDSQREHTARATARAEAAEKKAEEAETANNFDATRLKRLATICGLAYGNESDEFVLNVAGSILGEITRVVEPLFAQLTVQSAAVKRYKEVLDRYGKHDDECAAARRFLWNPQFCNCGLDAALATDTVTSLS